MLVRTWWRPASSPPNANARTGSRSRPAASAPAAGGILLAAPVLIWVGIVRVIDSGKVDKRIESRASPLPVTLPAGSDVLLDVFLPITPPPRALRFHYRTAQGDQQLQVDTSRMLERLHLAQVPASAR